MLADYQRLKFIGNICNGDRLLIEEAIKQSGFDIKIDDIAYQYGHVEPNYFSLYTSEDLLDHESFWKLFDQLRNRTIKGISNDK